MNNEYLTNKVDAISEDISEIKVILARNTSSLEEHMRRTAINEEQISMLREDLKPVEEHVAMVRWMLKATGVIAATIGFLAAFSSNIIDIIQNLRQ